MGVLKLNKERGCCSIEVKNDSNAGVMLDMADVDYKWKRGEDHKKKGVGNSRSRSDFRRKV